MTVQRRIASRSLRAKPFTHRRLRHTQHFGDLILVPTFLVKLDTAFPASFPLFEIPRSFHGTIITEERILCRYAE